MTPIGKTLTPEHRAAISRGKFRAARAARAARKAKNKTKQPSTNRLGWVMVDSSFIAPAARRLGTGVAGLAKLVGITDKAVGNYIHDRRCPRWFRAAVNGLLAEHDLGGVKAPREYAHGLPAVVATLPRPNALVVVVPPEQQPHARALLGALGWHVMQHGQPS